VSRIVIDPALCRRDGICVAECPVRLIEQQSGAFPAPSARAETDCIDCGHCVAVCPAGALSLGSTTPDKCPEVRADLLPDAAQAEHLLRTRRSIRTFRKEPVPRPEIERLLDIVRHAPSGSNGQPVEWMVVHDTERVSRIASTTLDWLRQQSMAPRYGRTFDVAAERGVDAVCRGAPHLVVAHTPAGQEGDGIIALTYLELAANGLGLGACWCGFVGGAIRGSPAVRKLVELPDGRSAAGVMLLGYPRYAYHRIPPRKAARVRWI
jgi:nitroreductase/NAD-dependent dihydropyrimidine dehydrogenase PreA subunit